MSKNDFRIVSKPIASAVTEARRESMRLKRERSLDQITYDLMQENSLRQGPSLTVKVGEDGLLKFQAPGRAVVDPGDGGVRRVRILDRYRNGLFDR